MKTNKLKAVILSLAALTAVASAYAESNQKADTVLNISKPGKVVIMEKAGSMTVVVDGCEGDSLFTANYESRYSPDSQVHSSQSSAFVGRMKQQLGYGEKSQKSSWDVIMGGLGFGLINPLNQTGGGGVQWSKSIEISWVNAFGVSYSWSNSRVSLAIGFDWRNYKSTLGRALIGQPDKGMAWGEYPDGTTGVNTRLKVFSLDFPLLYTYMIPKTQMRLVGGVILDINTYASLKTNYISPATGKRKSEFTKNIGKRTVTTSLFGAVMCHGCGVYVRYQPQKVLEHSDVNFNPLSMGVMFFL